MSQLWQKMAITHQGILKPLHTSQEISSMRMHVPGYPFHLQHPVEIGYESR